MPKNVGYKKVRGNVRNNQKNRKNAKNKKAYAPRRKQAVVRSLMPLAESRKYVITSPTNESLQTLWRVVVPNVWERMTREGLQHSYDKQLTSSSFSGNTLFSRYLNVESQIDFDHIRHNQEPVQLTIIQGWWKTPYITQPQSAGDILATRNAQGVLLDYNPEEYINFQMASMLSDRFDTIDKKKVKVKFKREYEIRGTSIQVINGTGDPPGTTTIKRECVRKQLKHNFTWKPMRKLHMTPATIYSATDTPNPANFKPDDQNCFWTPSAIKNEELWIPFVAYKFKNYTAYGVDEEQNVDANANPKLFIKQSHYFLDL